MADIPHERGKLYELKLSDNGCFKIAKPIGRPYTETFYTLKDCQTRLSKFTPKSEYVWGFSSSKKFTNNHCFKISIYCFFECSQNFIFTARK